MEKPKPLISVFMPARNEEANILQNFRILDNALEQGKINHAVIVIDGSRDRTREIILRESKLTLEQIKKLTSKKRGTLVLSNGLILINHREPEGKGRNFMEAMFTLKGRTKQFNQKNSIVVNIDADAVNLEEKKITEIAKEIHKREVPMLLGTHIEKGAHLRGAATASPNATGFRAMQTQALEPLFKFKSHWIDSFPRQFGMDAALNYLIYPQTIDPKKRFKIPQSLIELGHEKPGKHLSDSKQSRQRNDVRLRLTSQAHKTEDKSPESRAFREKVKHRLK